MPDGGHELIPGAHSRGFHRVFAWYLRRLLAKRFHAIRGEGDSVAVLDAAAAADAPVLLASNHGAWWDPLLGLWVHDRWFAGREPCSPIDAAMLAKFRFFRKLGMFGVHQDDPASLRAMVRYVDGVLARDPRGMLLVTPQGRFVDPRLPVEVRPGIGLVASRHPRASVLVAALEFSNNVFTSRGGTFSETASGIDSLNLAAGDYQLISYYSAVTMPSTSRVTFSFGAIPAPGAAAFAVAGMLRRRRRA